MNDPEAVAWLESEGVELSRAADSGSGLISDHALGALLDENADRLLPLEDFHITIEGSFYPGFLGSMEGPDHGNE